MKRILIVISYILILSFTGKAQSSLGKTDDLGRIAIAAIVPDEAGIPGGSQNMLKNKIMQITTQNGLGATEGNARFAMVPVVSIMSKDIAPGAPPMVTMNMEIAFYIVDMMSQTIFSQTSITMKAAGKSEEHAYSQVISNINPRLGQFRGFVEKGKEKIVEYYNSQCDVIISGSKALAGQKKYEEALYMLLSVPDVSRECFDKCMSISIDVYKEYANQKCNEYLSAAKAGWAAKELGKVEENLGKITPDMDCFPQAEQLLAQITASVEAEGAGAWNFKMKRYEDNVEKEKLMIEAGKDVAIAWAYWGAAPHFDWKWLYKN